jgi:predicted RND superfamily exporter protein
MREQLLLKLARLHANHPWRMVTAVTVLTLIFGFFSTKLTITMRWSDLLPEKDERTVEYNKIIREFKSASNIIVLIQGEESRIKSFADILAPRLLAAVDTSMNEKCGKEIARLQKKLEKSNTQSPDTDAEIRQKIEQLTAKQNFSLIQRVDYKAPENFIRNHGLLLMKTSDLADNEAIFWDPNLPAFICNLNNALEKEYVGRDESLSSREKRDQALMSLEGIEFLIRTLLKSLQGSRPDSGLIRSVVDRLLIGDPYFLSYDKKALLMIAVPTFSALDLDRMIGGTNTVQAILDSTLSGYPDIQAGLTGMIPLGRDEMVYGMESANVTSIIAVIAIFILLVLAFRMWIAPLFAVLNLLIGVLWAIGLTAMTVGQLNIMTQMMGVILLGLGIDYSIHFICGFTENRAAGQSIEESLISTFSKYGKGILTGGLTTSFAFLSLLISRSRGMKEMGLVTGIGLLAVLVTTFLALPAFLVFREQRIEKKKGGRMLDRDLSFHFLGKTGEWLGRRFRWTILASVLLTAVMVWQAMQITFDQNYMNMEPEGLPSVVLQDTITSKFDLSMDYALVLAGSPDESRELAKSYRQLKSTAMTEDIGLYLPSDEEQSDRIKLINRIRQKMRQSRLNPYLNRQDLELFKNEIERLSWNIMEIQDIAYLNGQDRVELKCRQLVGNPDKGTRGSIQKLMSLLAEFSSVKHSALNHFQSIFAPYLKNQLLNISSTDPVTLNDLPSSVLERYINQDSTQFLISIYPKASIWTDLQFLNQFTADLTLVNDRATGMPTIFQALIEIIGRDGRYALGLTLIVVFLLLWIDFSSPAQALLGIIPLLAGTLWMVGLMRVTGLQFTVINVMGLPMIIGIGIDDGVHIIHRWNTEGRVNLYRVFSSTGKAILLTTLTTMLAFGSLYFSIWRGFASLGSALFIGVGACFIATLLCLSGLLGMLTRQP